MFLRRVSQAGALGHLWNKVGGGGREASGVAPPRRWLWACPAPPFCHRLPAVCQRGLAGPLLQGRSPLGPQSLELLRRWEVRDRRLRQLVGFGGGPCVSSTRALTLPLVFLVPECLCLFV